MRAADLFESGLPRGAPSQGWTKRKALFFAGSPGAGKSSLARMTAVGLGFKHLDPDRHFEHLMRRYGLDPKMPPHEERDRYIVRGEALEIVARQRDLYADLGLGLIIDTTGASYGFVREVHAELSNADYECRMVLVETSLPTALYRNWERARTLPEPLVRDRHRATQANRQRFIDLFGTGSVLVVDNESKLHTNAPHVVNAYRSILRWIAH